MLFAFVARALVPAGFMPNLAALGDGRYELALCSAGAPAANSDETYSNRVPGKSESTGKSDCPFGTVTAKTLAIPDPAPAPAPHLTVRNSWVRTPATDWSAPVVWRSLGPRAPPVHLD